MTVPQKSENHERVVHRIGDLFLFNLGATEDKVLKWYVKLPLAAQQELMAWYGESPQKIVHGLIADGAFEAGMWFKGYEPVRHTDSEKELHVADIPTIAQLRAIKKDEWIL